MNLLPIVIKQHYNTQGKPATNGKVMMRKKVNIFYKTSQLLLNCSAGIYVHCSNTSIQIVAYFSRNVPRFGVMQFKGANLELMQTQKLTIRFALLSLKKVKLQKR